MAYQQEEKQTKLGRQLSTEAIALAIQGRWEEAVAVNRSIIERLPTDIGAYNRLGRALTELGEFVQAKEAYNRVLELAPDNVIAAKNLTRLASLSESEAVSSSSHHRITPALFVTEQGKADMVNLCNLASRTVLAKVGVGDQVHLRVEGKSLIVENEHGEYLGEVEKKYGLRLIRLIKGGNKYVAAILSVGNNKVQTIIREEYQHPSQAGQSSFPVRPSIHLPNYAKEPAPNSYVIANKEVEITEENETLPEGFSVIE
jgi:tetratricopeptide (TPR) repeat protein